MLVKITLDLEFALSYPCGFIPMHFGKANNPVRELYLGNSLPLPPPCSSIPTPKPA
jgi:hypothetical protein